MHTERNGIGYAALGSRFRGRSAARSAGGISELVSRYRDAPKAALYTKPAQVYVALNVVASGLALALIRGYGWTFDATGAGQRWT
jgi:hypothetical protein